MNVLIEIAFRALNVVFLGVIFFYCIRYVLLPFVRIRKKQDEENIDLLQKRLDDLAVKKVDAEGRFLQECATWDILRQKVVYWHSVDAQSEVAKQLETAVCRKNSRHKREKVIQRSHEDAVRTVIISQALQKSLQELAVLYETDKAGQNYIMQSLEKMVNK